MIIELFGPPASGKTTLAHALRTTLAEHGHAVELVASSRPAERAQGEARASSMGRRGSALVAPLMRAAKLATALPALVSRSPAPGTAAALLGLLPPRSLASRVRYRRYLALLEESWTRAASSHRITILDQGWLSAVSSLALLARPADPMRIAAALDLVPKADLLVCLDAPHEILRERLIGRLGRQSVLERLFELDLDSNLRQREIVAGLAGMMAGRQLTVMRLDSIDAASLEAAARTIAAEACRRLGPGFDQRAATERAA